MSIKKILIRSGYLVIFLIVAFQIKHMYWDDADKPLPADPWIVSPTKPAPKQAEAPLPTPTPKPAAETTGKWVKSPEKNKADNGKPITQWDCESKVPTEQLMILGKISDYDIRGIDSVIAEFESVKGQKVSIFFNPVSKKRKLGSMNGIIVTDKMYEDIGKTAKFIRFLPDPAVSSPVLSVSVMTHDK